METATTASPAATAALAELRSYCDEVRDLGHVLALLNWDEKTKMPVKGGASRARQKAALAGILHERGTSDRLRGLIDAVEDADPGNAEARVMRRDLERSTKLPTEFVREFTAAVSLAGHQWKVARERDDFATFAPHLETLVTFARRKAELLGFETEPFDALHDIYEEGSTAADLEPMFAELRVPINELIDRQPEPDVELLRRRYPIDLQRRFEERIVTSIGFDLAAGRIDPTAHPFCIDVGAGDVRLTTRYDEHRLSASLFAVIHEAGHGIYNQSFDRLGLPSTIGSAPGLGMHESQSRMYENVVGRSLAFWQHHFDELQRTFPEALGAVEVEEFVRAINVSQRSPIRVEADELTYNLHVGVRFEIERALINGDLDVADLPAAWNDAMERWVGLRPESDREGCLQDVHWSLGAFGYFPTYTLGNLYAAQFVEAARRELGDLDLQMRGGDLLPLRLWLDDNIYCHGRSMTGRQLVEHVTGRPPTAAPFIEYLRDKFGDS